MMEMISSHMMRVVVFDQYEDQHFRTLKEYILKGVHNIGLNNRLKCYYVTNAQCKMSFIYDVIYLRDYLLLTVSNYFQVKFKIQMTFLQKIALFGMIDVVIE